MRLSQGRALVAPLVGRRSNPPVIHVPQVAAQAKSHSRIAKDQMDKGGRVATGVTHLGEAARREKIARMLPGATITEEARAAAGRLLEGAGVGAR
ncbi:MAG: hypothetical protein ACLQLT_04630 [Methylovirgula sp.]